MSRAADAAPAHEQVHERSQKSWYFAGGPDIPGMTMTSKALRGRTDIAPFITRLLGLGLLTLAAAACSEPDPNDEPGTTDGTTTHTTIPDECGTGGGDSNDYCCQFNSNYCDSDTDTDGTTTSTTTNTTIPEDCVTGGGSDFCCEFNPSYCDTDTNTDTDPMPPDTDTAGTIPGCECISDEEQDVSLPACGEQLCGDVRGSCEGTCGDWPLELASPDALECALTALRDRTPGLYTWTWSANGGQYSEDGYVLINADGSAVHRKWGWSDMLFEASPAALGELPPAEHFDACLADPDDLARFDCLRAELDSTQAVCNGGWQDTKDGV